MIELLTTIPERMVAQLRQRIRDSEAKRDFCTQHANQAFARTEPELGHLLTDLANYHGDDAKQMRAFLERAERLK